MKNSIKSSVVQVSFAFLLISCSGNDEFSPIQKVPFTVVSHELDGITVNELVVKDDWIFAATSDGVYGKNTGSSGSNFTLMGLKGNNVVDVHAFTDSELLASTINFTAIEMVAKVYKTSNAGEEWTVFESNFGSTDVEFGEGLSDFEAVPGEPDHLYASGRMVVAKSTDKGLTWNVLWGGWDMTAQPSMNIAANPAIPDELWVGGQGSIENGYLVRLKNGQEQDAWFDLVPNPTVVKEIVFDAENPQSVYVGWEGELSKSTDNGKTWKTLINRHEEAHFFFGIGISPRSSKLIYSGKWIKAAETQKLEIFCSQDGGENWQITEFPQITQGGVYDLKVIRDGDLDRIFVGLFRGGIVEMTFK